MVHCDTDGKYVWLYETNFTDAPKCKTVAGARWGGQLGVERDSWRFPLDMASCRGLRAAFADRLTVGPALAAWARDKIVTEKLLTDLKSQTSADLVNVGRYAPRIAAAMANRTYQQVGAAFGARAGNFLLADQPGLGKTIQALGGLVESNADTPGIHLVFCPLLAVTLVWAPEVAQWLGTDAECFPLSGNRAKREATLAAAFEAHAQGKRNVFVIGNIEMTRVGIHQVYDERKGKDVEVEREPEYPELFGLTWDSVIVDESHRALIRTSGKPTQVRRGMMKLRADRKIALSGTPMRGKPEQLWGTLNWLRPDLYTSYWNWVKRYFALTSNGYSNFIIDGFKKTGEEDLAADLHSIMLRRTKAEVLSELPPKTFPGTHLIPGDDNSPHAIWLDPSPAQLKLGKRLDKDGVIYGATDADTVMVNGVLAVRTRQKQLANSAVEVRDGQVEPVLPSPKFDWLVDKINELGIPDGEGRIVVGSHSTRLVNLFARELEEMGIACHLITGETPEKVRLAAQNDFQSDTPTKRVFLMNIKAGGVAITLDAADDLVELDESENPDDAEQFQDRIHRTSRIHNVTIHRLRTLDSIEEEIAWVAAARGNVQEYLLDESRGVAVARKLYLQATGHNQKEG